MTVYADGQGRCIRPEAPNFGPLIRQRPVKHAEIGREHAAATATRAFRPEPEIVVGRSVGKRRDMVEERALRDPVAGDPGRETDTSQALLDDILEDSQIGDYMAADPSG